jgi:hypothetical protein
MASEARQRLEALRRRASRNVMRDDRSAHQLVNVAHTPPTAVAAHHGANTAVSGPVGTS